MLVLVLALLMWKPRLSESVMAGPWLEALWSLGEARLWMWQTVGAADSHWPGAKWTALISSLAHRPLDF